MFSTQKILKVSDREQIHVKWAKIFIVGKLSETWVRTAQCD